MAEGMIESLAAFDIFSELSIPNARAKERSRRLKTSNLSDLLPLYGPWVGHNRPSILLRSRYGTLLGIDPFAPELTNFCQIICGSSGSGKSYLTNLLLLQMLNDSPKVFIVDIGGSYKKLCDNLGGQYVPLGVDVVQSLNPFDLLDGEVLPSNSKIKFLVGLIEMMTKEDKDLSLNRLQRVEIEEAIQKVYDKEKAPTLAHLREILLSHNDSEIKRIGRILTSWCGNSPYGKFVDRPTTIQLKRPVVCFDLKGMEAYPDLQAACLYIITDFVWREVQRDRSTKKFLVFDECWKLLESESTFIAETFRTFRKYLGSVIAISQNIDDFAKSKVAAAILSNSATKWILMQKGADQARLQEVLQLNPNEMDAIASLHQEKGVYSEAFLMMGDRHCVVVVEATPLEYWIATTDPSDVSTFDQALKESPNVDHLSILKILAEKYPRGVAAAQRNSS